MRRSLDRVLSKAGVCSRTQARKLASEGRVRVNGRRVADVEALCDDARDRIEIDGKRLERATKLYFAFHKPRGCVTTRSDPDGRPTVYDHLEDVDAWIAPVGRLDVDTSGLLLFTNDTQLSDAITSPASHLEKVYRVEARPRLDAEAFERLRAGPMLADGPTRPARVTPLFDVGQVSVFEIAISEGRNRQVRRMVKAVGARVVKLARTAIGPIALGELERGKLRPLARAEIAKLRASVGPRA